MNGQIPVTAFTQKLEERVNETKKDEEKRREYMLLKSFEMDARRAGIQEGILQGRSEGMQAGIAQGFTDGITQTAKKLIDIGLSLENITKATGLSKEEIENL